MQSKLHKKSSYKNTLILGASVIALSVFTLPITAQAHDIPAATANCHVTSNSGAAGGAASSAGLCTTPKPADVPCPPTIIPSSSSSSSSGGDGGGGGDGGHGHDVDGDGIGDFGSSSEASAAGFSGGTSVGNCGGCGGTSTSGGTPHGSSSSSSSGSGGGSGGGSVLCGHYFNRDILSYDTYMGDLTFAQTNTINAATLRGYHAWAIPLTRYLNNNQNGLVEKIVQPFVLGWAQEMAFKTGYSDKGSTLGKALLTLVPAVTLIGHMVSAKDYNSLASEKQIKQRLFMQRQAEAVTKSYNDYRFANAA